MEFSMTGNLIYNKRIMNIPKWLSFPCLTDCCFVHIKLNQSVVTFIVILHIIMV